MRKILFTTLLAVIFMSAGFAQKSAVIKLNGNEQKFEVTSLKSTGFSIKNSVSELKLNPVSFSKGNFMSLEIEGLGKVFTEGLPNIPVISKLIEVPQGAEVEFIVKSYDEQIIKLSDYGITDKIQPALQSLSKSESKVPFVIKEDVYKTDAFINKNIAVYQESGMMRNVRLGRIEISPIQYNPVTNTLRILNNLEIEVVFKNADLGKTSQMAKKYQSPFYENIFATGVINHIQNSKEFITQTPTEFVIVADRMFEATLTPFIAWKQMKGFHVTVAYTDVIGTTTTAIKTYLQGLYSGSTPPSFVLFVGDVAQVPAFTGTSGSHVSDLYYCEYTDDKIPEVLYGRFSASTTAQLASQINKSLEYEKYLMPDPSYLDEVVMVAGDDESWEDVYGNGQINYGTTYYFNGDNGITSHTYLQDLDNNAASIQIIQNVSNGVAYGNYTAHCSPAGWYSPSFETSDVPGLQNASQYGLLVGNCCLSNKFDDTECFGEALLRAENKGAIGYIGGSNSTYWDEDYYWGCGFGTAVEHPVYTNFGTGAYDGVFHTLVNEVSNLDKWYITQAQMNLCGQLAVEASTSTRKTYYWEIYHLMGDPSIINYMSVPDAMTVTPSPATLMIGMTTLQVTSAPYSYVALSQGGTLLATAISSDLGVAQLNFTGLSVGTADLVVTAQNKQPYIGTITVSPANEPYIVLNSYTTSASPDFGQTIDLNITLENVAASGSGYDAASVAATLSITDTYVTINNNSASFGTIIAGTTETVNAAFNITIANNVPDQHVFNFDMTITGVDAKYTWPATLTMTANAPLLTPGTLTILNDDNADGILDPNETADVKITASNTGHADITNVIGAIAYTGSDLTINTGLTSATTLAIGETKDFMFNVSANAATPAGTPATIEFDVTGGTADQYTAAKDFTVIIGFVPEYCASGATNTGDSNIEQVNLGTIATNTTGECTGYTDFTEDPAATTVLVIGSTVNMSFFLGNCDSGNFLKAGKVYIDWNYDGDFDDAGEMIHEAAAQNANWLESFTFTVPAVNPGPKFMRLVVSEDETNVNPCGTYSYGETEDYKITLAAPIAPIADFSANETIITAGATVQFTDLSQNYPTLWLWEISGSEGSDYIFTNTTTSASQNPSVKFLIAGSYDVTMTATNSISSDSEAKADYITVNAVTTVSVADFTANFTTIPTGDKVTFTDLSTNLPDAWNWTVEPSTGVVFTDGTDNTSQNPIVQFNEAGVFSVSLTAHNSIGYSAPVTKTDYITASNEITIGTGTIQSSPPFNNYWENNKTQIIYYQSEIGAAKDITTLALDFSHVSADASDRIMNNLKINMMPTSMSEFSAAYIPSTSATTVFSQATYTLPDVTGLHTFDITDYQYNGTDNLLVEIVWGDNGFYTSDSYKVNSTTVAKAYVVAYGYDDYATPTYDGQSADRPNVKLGFSQSTIDVSDVQKSKIMLYPNPNTGEFTVNLNGLKSGKSTVSVYNINGQMVYQNLNASAILNVDLSQEPRGIYFVKISSGSETFNQKVVLY